MHAPSFLAIVFEGNNEETQRKRRQLLRISRPPPSVFTV
jgi:hypothetical protein